ncbi:MAG: outer membrane protein [Rhodoblastus sp.]
MRLKLIVAIAASTIAGSAVAADLPMRGAIVPPPAFEPLPVLTWSGFYMGLDLGYAWQSLNSTFGPWGNIGSNVNPSGILGGAYIGYNFQVSPMFVLGVEGDIEGGSVRQGRDIAVIGSHFAISDNFRASARARAGLAFGQALWYVTGGVAFANFNHTLNWFNGSVENWSNGRSGWTAGTGLEYAFARNWIGRVEYRFSQFGNFSRWSPAAGYAITERVNDSAVRAGIAYKFGNGY